MIKKIEITGVITSTTGMHIGGSSYFSAIGAVDSPVIRDTLSNLPMIPGSSLKGKMRSLLARQYNPDNRIINNPNQDDEKILRLFGSSEKNRMKQGRLIFSDMVMVNSKELSKIDVRPIEVKFENTISRIDAEAKPRQIERSVRGAKYLLSLIYNMEEQDELLEDFKTLRDGFLLLQYDYLGGHGSRGYGKIRFTDLDLDCVIGKIDESLLEECRTILKEGIR